MEREIMFVGVVWCGVIVPFPGEKKRGKKPSRHAKFHALVTSCIRWVLPRGEKTGEQTLDRQLSGPEPYRHGAGFVCLHASMGTCMGR